jgi:hypothetical protein
MPRIKWAPVLEHAADIVGSYQTAPTLRQLFYRLVVNETLPNTLSRYKDLSANTAQARRDGWFPPLFDRTRRVHQPATFDSPKTRSKCSPTGTAGTAPKGSSGRCGSRSRSTPSSGS